MNIERNPYVKVNMSVTILIVDKYGKINEKTIKKLDETELYKKAGLKSATGFKLHSDWIIPDLKGDSYHIHLYGKTEGRANSENKYEFPPPVDSVLFFGSCILLNKDATDKFTSISKKEWTSIYEYLYGGFDDIDDDEDEEEEDDEDDGLPRTKSGYVKDNFIVDDDEGESNEDSSVEEESFDEGVDSEPPTRRSLRKKVPPVNNKKSKKSKIILVNNFVETEEPDNFLDCTGELSEEEYV
jgi:hypothetical protein